MSGAYTGGCFESEMAKQLDGPVARGRPGLPTGAVQLVRPILKCRIPGTTARVVSRNAHAGKGERNSSVPVLGSCALCLRTLGELSHTGIRIHSLTLMC